MARNTRPISWINAARRDFEEFPAEAQLLCRRALTIVAEGRIPDIAKPLKGFGSGILELALRHRGDAYRVVYAVQIGTEKKSKSGIKTPQSELDVIRQRLRRLREMLR
jgi:phage-related protein